MTATVRIGLWLPEKKKKKMKIKEFEKLCSESGVHMVELDLDRSVEEQGPFDIILHKMNDEISIKAESGDHHAQKQLANFKKYIKSHPEVPLIDQLERTSRLDDRKRMFSLLQQADIVHTDNAVFVPSFVEITGPVDDVTIQRLQACGVQFPCVCKPSDASTPETSHDMSLVFSARGLSDMAPPCVAQSFINHNGVLHKIFMFGDKCFCVKRPSIKNLTAGDFPTEHFRTHEVSKPNSTSHLNKAVESEDDVSRLDIDLMQEIGRSVRRTLGLNLLGIDVIIEDGTGRYCLIDVNPFPGYLGVPDMHQELLDFLLEHIQLTQNNNK